MTMTMTDWWQQERVRAAMAHQDAPRPGETCRPCGCLADPVVFGHYWCGTR